MRTNYSFSEVLQHVEGLDRSRLTRWSDAGIIQAGGGGGKGQRREFSLQHIVYAAICDRLHRLGCSEAVMRGALRSVEYAWLSGARVAFRVNRDTLWLRIDPYQIRSDGVRASMEYAGDSPGESFRRGGPLVNVENHMVVAAEIRDGTFGIAIPLRQIVAAIERSTGDKLE
jgi:hypothetical protein